MSGKLLTFILLCGSSGLFDGTASTWYAGQCDAGLLWALVHPWQLGMAREQPYCAVPLFLTALWHVRGIKPGGGEWGEGTALSRQSDVAHCLAHFAVEAGALGFRLAATAGSLVWL